MTLFVITLRNGAILATLAATPILIGFIWDAVWGESRGITVGTYTALILAWLGAVCVVAVMSYNAARTGNTLAWFYPCTNCGRGVAIFAYRCMNCKTNFTPPPAASTFRSSLLLGVAVFYGTFTLGAFLFRLNS